MRKSFYTLLLLTITIIVKSQSLTYSSKSAKLFLDKSSTVPLKSYYTDTIRIFSNNPNDTVMVYHIDSLIASNMLNTYLSLYPAKNHTEHQLYDVVGYRRLWMDFAFTSALTINTRDLFYEKFVVYSKKTPNLRDTITFYLQFAPTGISNSTAQIENPIYPNPANSTITLDKAVTSIRIIDNIGNVVFVSEAIENNKVDISVLSCGIYYVESYTEEGVIREKLIKN